MGVNRRGKIDRFNFFRLKTFPNFLNFREKPSRQKKLAHQNIAMTPKTKKQRINDPFKKEVNKGLKETDKNFFFNFCKHILGDATFFPMMSQALLCDRTILLFNSPHL